MGSTAQSESPASLQEQKQQMGQQSSKLPDNEPQDQAAPAQHSRQTQTEVAAEAPGGQQPAQQSEDPAAVDADGWPLLHRVVTAAAAKDPNPPKAEPDNSSSTPDQPGPGGGTGSGMDCATAMATLEEVLARCKDVNLKGPGGFTALHLACLGPLSRLQLK